MGVQGTLMYLLQIGWIKKKLDFYLGLYQIGM